MLDYRRFMLVQISMIFLILTSLQTLDGLLVTSTVIISLIFAFIYFLLLDSPIVKNNYYLSNYYHIIAAIIFSLNLRFVDCMPEDYNAALKLLVATFLSIIFLFIFFIANEIVTADIYTIDNRLNSLCLMVSISVIIDIALYQFFICYVVTVMSVVLSDKIFDMQHRILQEKLKISFKRSPDSMLVKYITLVYIINIKIYMAIYENEYKYNEYYCLFLTFGIPITIIFMKKYMLLNATVLFLIILKRANILSHFNNVKRNPEILDILGSNLDYIVPVWLRNLGKRVINHAKENNLASQGNPGGSNRGGNAIAAVGVGIAGYSAHKGMQQYERSNDIAEKALIAQEKSNEIAERAVIAQEEANAIAREQYLASLENNHYTARGAVAAENYNEIAKMEFSEVTEVD